MEENIPEGYQNTEVGIIPDDWGVRELGSISKVVRGGSPRPAGDPKFFGGIYIPWLTVAALTNIPESSIYVSQTIGFLTEEGAKYSRTLENGTLIIANSGATLGVAKILAVKCCANDGIAAFIDLNKDADKLFLYYVLNAKTREFREVVATGNGQPNLNTTLIGLTKISLPLTIEEQEAIAQSLSDVDALITECDRIIAKKRNTKQGTMQQLLIGKKRLPGFSGEWKETILKSVIKLTNGFAFKSEYFSENGPIVLTPGNFKLQGGLYFNEKNTKRYSGSFPITAKFHNGDLLVVMTDLTKECNLLGKPAIIESTEEILHNQRIGKIEILKSEVHKNFLFYFFLSNEYHLGIKESATGSTVRHTSSKSIYSIPLPLPPTKEEQKAIAQILSDMDAEIAALEQKCNKYKNLRQGMMQELLTGKTRLKYDLDD